ncbi:MULTISPECIES: DNA-binding protein [Desulfosediminicola]|uniref:DNA-binding protein n=1 Tax=Desulfosediminicola TaxID=2886823 RepID=UPI0010AD697D|nr:DNA-binding protein [Desulfosediminicola ganghwensis]
MQRKSVLYIAAACILGLSALTPPKTQAQEVAGIVLETMNAAGYTYLQVDNGSTKDWVAVPETQVQIGDHVTYNSGMEMSDFHSKTLDRTFPSIIFAGALINGTDLGDVPAQPVVAAVEPAPSKSSFADAVAREQNKATDAQDVQGEASPGSTGAIVPFTDIKVEKATSEKGYSVEEIFAKAKELNGQTVHVRGKVVKFNPNIMGRNWVHLQDGTGNPMQNTHDLVVTTSDTPDQDSIILIEGKLSANKDFGAGYKYEVIIEEARIVQ